MSKKPNLSSQDVRAKILQLRDSLVLNLEFIQEAVDRDLEFLQAYYKQHGDLNYRPVIGRNIDNVPNYGERTELMIEPVASKYRATIKSLLDSVRLIESEILPEDNPEGATASSSPQAQEQSAGKRASLRADFQASAGTSGKAIEPDNSSDEEAETEEENAVQQTELAEKPKPAPVKPSKPAIQTKPIPEPQADPQPKARPWRTKPQATLIKTESPEAPHVEKEPEGQVQPKPEQKSLTSEGPLEGESARMREELKSLMSGSGKMAGLIGKYGKKSRVAPTEDED